MYTCNPDQAVWLDSYKEEYNGLTSNDTFDIISEDEYIRFCKTFTIKKINGVPTWAKSRIVVLVIYVDVSPYFSLDGEVEQYFQTALPQKVKVVFFCDDKWYLGIKFDWNTSSDGFVSYRISQEGYAAATIEEMGLSNANKFPLMTPYCSSLPVDTIPSIDMSRA
jgi:hypothetical protein